jgi:uncharacterized membrane protein YfcA
MFDFILLAVSILAGLVAGVAGFGIGSFITPVLAFTAGTGIAVAAVSIIHFFGTLLRFVLWRMEVNWKVLISFGLMSAAGGLVGALLHNILFNQILTIIFGCLLVFSGASILSGLSDKLHFKGVFAWIAGGISGFFGGLVGNQGGIRSAAMFGFKLDRKAFIATATGIALLVDIVRMPVYLATQLKELLAIWPLILIGSVGVLAGTLIGGSLLEKIPEKRFKQVVAILILLIGIYILANL